MHSHNAGRQFISFIVMSCLALFSPGLVFSQSASSTPAAPNAPPPGGDPWPRQLTYQGAKISVYQPQLESWTGNLLTAYTAVTIMAGKAQQLGYGVIWFTAHTEVDKVNRVVTLFDFRLTKQKFPSLPNNGSAYTAADGGPFVGTLDLTTGVITPIVTGLSNPGGMMFVDTSQQDVDPDHGPRGPGGSGGDVCQDNGHGPQ